MKLLLVVLVALALYAASVSAKPMADPPAVGFRSVLTAKGYDEVLAIVIPLANSLLTNLAIADVTESIKVPLIGTVAMTVNNIDVNYVDLGTGVFTTAAPNLITIGFTNAHLKLAADFKWKQKSWPHTSDHGHLTAEPKQGAVHCTITLGVDAKGDVAIALQSVDVNFSDYDLHFSNHWDSWVYNAFTDIFSKTLTKSINSALQDEAKSALPPLINSLLDDIPKTITVGHGGSATVADIETFSVNVTADSISVANAVAMSNLETNESCPIEYPPIPNFINGGGSAQLMAGNTIFNCPLWVMYKNGVIKDSIESNTSTWKPFIPLLYQKYPDDKLTLNYVALKRPQVTFDAENGASVAISMSMQQVVDVKGQNATIADTIQIDGAIAVKLSVSSRKNEEGNTDNVLNAEITKIKLELSVIDSNIGDIDVTKLNAATAIIAAAIKGIVDEIFQDGFVIPMIPDVILVDPEISFFANYFAIDSHFAPQPAFFTRFMQQH
jgi:hypothetical protein